MNNSRKYNKKALTGYFDAIFGSFDDFKHRILKFDSSMKSFVDRNSWEGVSAEAAKVLTKEAEPALIQNICYLQNEMIDLQNDLLEMFYYDVDRNSFANFETDMLEQVQSELSDFKMEYETIACEVESIAESLQKYSKYGSFSAPDFSATRLAYTDICGDGADEEGHINHCLTLLDAYDAEATELILDRGIDKKIAQLQWQLESHFGVAMPGTDYSTMLM